MGGSDKNLRRRAIEFVVLLGFVSLFADVTYEGARSITGPFMAMLGASATVVGFVAGFGELIGYGVRLATGYLADRTGKYWGLTILGYALNLIAVPCLAFAGRWEIAAGLIIMERLGKAIRSPARDAILSSATHQVGRGWGFGLHEFMDQIGAVSGPLLMVAALAMRHSYQFAFGILLVPAILAMAVLVSGRVIYPRPQDFEPVSARISSKKLGREFWIYMLGVGLVAAGFADFALAAFHFKKAGLFTDAHIPLLYAGAMGVDAIAALVFGRLFDRIGILTMGIATVLSMLFAPCIFLGNASWAIVGMALWGIGMGAQESIMRAAVAQMVSPDRRGSAYGLFNAGYGVMWFAGSAIMGILYDISIVSVVVMSIATQFAAVVIFLAVWRVEKRALREYAEPKQL